MVDKSYCMSSYLMYRTLAGSNKRFAKKMVPNIWMGRTQWTDIHNGNELEDALRKEIEKVTCGRKAALALSGGIDSAILAKYMPEGSIAYTFKCIVPGMDVIDETPAAARYAQACGLEHRIVEIYWEDFEKYAPILMKHKGAPVHSIEIQIYKASLQAKQDGNDCIIFGESCDLNYGGLSGLLSKDWTVGEFIDRYAYVKPYHVLKDFRIITSPCLSYEENGYINVHEFCRGYFMTEAMGSYTNACECAGIELSTPYATTKLAIPLDLERIRRGENKYLVREVFNQLYPGFAVPTKTPMPRPMNEWFRNWEGPKRSEFWPHCTDHMTGDQKWMVWALERFLDICDEQ